MWFSIVCTLINNDIHLLWTHKAHNILTSVMTNIIVDESTNNAEPHSILDNNMQLQYKPLYCSIKEKGCHFMKEP